MGACAWELVHTSFANVKMAFKIGATRFFFFNCFDCHHAILYQSVLSEHLWHIAYRADGCLLLPHASCLFVSTSNVNKKTS
jgi:hypothetical protein